MPDSLPETEARFPPYPVSIQPEQTTVVSPADSALAKPFQIIFSQFSGLPQNMADNGLNLSDICHIRFSLMISHLQFSCHSVEKLLEKIILHFCFQEIFGGAVPQSLANQAEIRKGC